MIRQGEENLTMLEDENIAAGAVNVKKIRTCHAKLMKINLKTQMNGKFPRTILLIKTIRREWELNRHLSIRESESVTKNPFTKIHKAQIILQVNSN